MLKKLIIPLTAGIFLSCVKEKDSPRLVVLLVVDHLSYNTYQHYSPLFKGGFKWLYDHGVVFENAHLEHGYASTAPGHFVLGTGLHPGPVGVLGNHFYDKGQGRDIYVIEDSTAQELSVPAHPVSYKNVPGSTFGDWLKNSTPGAKVVGVGCKDRAAILLSGREADLAVWYNWRGSFTSNSFYTESIPTWLNAFDGQVNMASYRDSLWIKSLPETVYDQYAHADSFPGESDRYLTETYSPVFPKGFEDNWNDAHAYGEMGNRPWLDRMTLQLANTVVQEEKLGMDEIPDVLSIGLSVMDIVVHYYGPYSHETMDLLIKIDGYLQDFLNELDVQVGLENVVFTMTTDHGGLPLPEHWTQIMGKQGGRIDKTELEAAVDRAYASTVDLYGTDAFILRRGHTYFYDKETMRSSGIEKSLVDSIFQSELESVKGIAQVYTKAELLAPTPGDKIATRLSRITHPDLSPDLYAVVDHGWIYRGPHGTSHRAPYNYDSHIPLIFSHASFEHKTVPDSVQMTDVAPTLGDILGVSPTTHVDGESLTSYLF